MHSNLGLPGRWRRRGAPVLAAVVAVAAFSALPVLVLIAQAGPEAASPPASAPTEGAGGLSALLGEVEAAVQPFHKQVEGGHVVAKFGEKAQGILDALAARAGGQRPEIQRAADALLQTLFLRQLSLLRHHLAAKFEKAARPVEAVSQADVQFLSQARELVRPGSSWSFDQERYALRAALEGTFRREAALAEERQRAAQTQQSTVEIISKLQSQMETLQQRVQHMRAGSPWFLSTSYRIPGTPLQLIGRYQQGRANLEINLSPDKDPANAQAGFVEGFGPPNVGVSLNLGL